MLEPRVEHDERALRYRLTSGTTVLSEITYSVSGDTVAFEHTTTPVHHRGNGHAGMLTSAALDDLRARGCRLIAACPYTRAYLRRNPDQVDLVADDGEHPGNGASESGQLSVTRPGPER